MVHGIGSRLYKDIHGISYRHRVVILDFLALSDTGRRQKQKKAKSNEIVQLFKCSIEDLPALAMPAASKAGTTMPVTSIPDRPPTFPVDENPALIDGEDATSQPQSVHRQEDVVTRVAAAKRERHLARPPSPLSQGEKEGLISYPSSQQPDRRKQTVIHPGSKKSMFLKSARLVPLPLRVTGPIICPSCGGDGQDGRGVLHGKQAKLVA